MADAAVSFLVSDVVLKLTSSTIHKFRLLGGLEDDVSALRTTLEQIQAVLQDAEVKQRNQKAVETWLKTLKSVSLEMENVLDEVSVEAMQQRLHVERGIRYRVRAFFSSDHNQLLFRIRIIHKLKNIRRRLDAIAARRSDFHLIPTAISVDARVGGDRRSTETSSLIQLSKIYGRDAEMEMIARAICNKYIARHYVDDVRVYAIWGMGGVGKTTLAQLVYNHEMVKKHFDLKAWVYVSSEFEIEKLTRGIIESIGGRYRRHSSLDFMQGHLQGLLHEKSFFIVLDDVWNEDQRKWDEVSKALSCGAEGSIVMVTTRSQKISTMMAKVPEFVHKVGCLSKEDSWSLFKKLAFAVGREGEDISELEHVGMEIVDKCKGLPLAVTALGSLMWSKRSVIEWQHVKDSELWELRENVDILPALEVSYDDLPSHMKRCFAYCCLFPKGYEMGKDLLIELWIANGLIPSDGGSDLYMIGDEIFDYLCVRCFFQDVQKKQTSTGWTCKMHDTMHDLARHVMGDYCSVEFGKKLKIPVDVLHLTSSCPNLESLDQDSEKLRLLRSIFIFAHEYKGSISQILEHKYLRVLHLIGIGGTTLPESIGKLKHLRYLNLSGSNINVLPESVIYLQNLLVLILHSCMQLRKLPDGMKYLRNLRCLDIRCCFNVKYMPVGMKKLASLERLFTFIVGEKKGARIGELGDLNLLGGELEIKALDYVQGLEDARSAKLCKSNLVSLVLRWGDVRKSLYSESVEPVLEGLNPNSSLKVLEIGCYPGEKISPRWMVDLRNLVSVKFCDSNECDSISGLGRLPNLKIMDILRMYNLKRLHDEDNTTSGDDILFPSLEILQISICYNFISLPSNLPKLKELNITHCETLPSLPDRLQSLRELEIEYCPALRSLPDGLQKLTHLRIVRCGDLARRCEEEIGEDWPKISHVSNIRIR